MEIKPNQRGREAPPLPQSQPCKLDCGKPPIQSSCWAALAAAKLLFISFGKKQSRWKFPVGWSWPRDHCLDDTPPGIRAIHSLQQADWPYCPLLQHSSAQSLQSVIKHSATWAHFTACARVGTKPWRKIWPCHAKQRNTWATLAST